MFTVCRICINLKFFCESSFHSVLHIQCFLILDIAAISKAPLPQQRQAVKMEQPTTSFINKPSKRDESSSLTYNNHDNMDARVKAEKSSHNNQKQTTDSRRSHHHHHADKGALNKELQHPLDSKRLHELYQTRRDKLWTILRHRLQYYRDSVNSEEKMYYQKLDENRKRKHAEAQKLNKVENTNGVSTASPSTEQHGSLKLKIRVGPPPDGHPSKTNNVGSSSGSGSDYSSPARPRKRGHHNDSSAQQPEAKLYKR